MPKIALQGARARTLKWLRDLKQGRGRARLLHGHAALGGARGVLQAAAEARARGAPTLAGRGEYRLPAKAEETSLQGPEVCKPCRLAQRPGREPAHALCSKEYRHSPVDHGGCEKGRCPGKLGAVCYRGLRRLELDSKGRRAFAVLEARSAAGEAGLR